MKDINKINPKDIPKHTVLTAGFPCQDFSIANSNQPDGIKGDKGDLIFTNDKLSTIISIPILLLIYYIVKKLNIKNYAMFIFVLALLIRIVSI